MRSLAMLKPVKSILWSVALLLLGNGLLNTLLTLRGTGEGFSSAVLGMIMSGYFVGFICGTWVSGRLIRRMGHIRTFGFCASICASVALLHLVFINPWVWLPLRVVYGLSFITLITVIESWLNSQAASHERGRIFAVYMVVNLGALATAQQLLRLASPQGFLLFVVIAILISWALLPITMTRRVQPKIPERPKSSLRALLGFAPLAVAQLIDQLHPDEIVSGSADMLVMHGAGCAVAPIAAGSLMTIVGSHGLPIYIASVFTVLGIYELYRRRHVSALVTHTAHFEPMVQSSAEAFEMIFDDTQRDLFDDPSFYEEEERQRLVGLFKPAKG
ncbi:MFS transporter [Halomonas sp. GFAJ-1]|uniref:MFS transporter n=1 Tax=Halomonas sp. GFAJ-1 TaxID=1118153 RepID=UPI00023A4246|nr:MFS transporter [Halomonas sp. GFAJ-1]AVI62629.1 MFS transporter [Halomonas sp. GFAJ-1]EHK59868.1 major facilitator family protein [Halomonas sp. GFAJ-1]